MRLSDLQTDKQQEEAIPRRTSTPVQPRFDDDQWFWQAIGILLWIIIIIGITAYNLL